MAPRSANHVLIVLALASMAFVVLPDVRSCAPPVSDPMLSTPECTALAAGQLPPNDFGFADGLSCSITIAGLVVPIEFDQSCLFLPDGCEAIASDGETSVRAAMSDADPRATFTLEYDGTSDASVTCQMHYGVNSIGNDFAADVDLLVVGRTIASLGPLSLALTSGHIACGGLPPAALPPDGMVRAVPRPDEDEFLCDYTIDVDVSFAGPGSQFFVVVGDLVRWQSGCGSDGDCCDGQACVFAFGGAGGTCYEKATGSPCADDHDCPEGHTCEGVCTPHRFGTLGRACDGDADCDHPLDCLNHVCLQCITGAECGADEVCLDGLCQVAADHPACQLGADCGAGEVCRPDQVCASCDDDFDCFFPARCLGGECLECATDNDCSEPTLQTCADGVCCQETVCDESGLGPPCPAQVPCFDGAVPTAAPGPHVCAEPTGIFCGSDSDCGPDERCLTQLPAGAFAPGYCQAPAGTSCTVDDDCSPDACIFDAELGAGACPDHPCDPDVGSSCGGPQCIRVPRNGECARPLCD